MPDDVLPANQAAERSVLGACIESESLLTSALAEGLTADDFTGDYPRVFLAMMEMRSKRLPVDFISLPDYLGNGQREFALIGDVVSGAVVHESHVMHHVQIVRQKSRLRSLLRLSDWIAQAAVEPCADPEQIARLVCERLEPASVIA